MGVALTHGAVHQVTPFVDLGRKKREADAEADAEADPYAYHYSSVSTPYAHYGTFVPDQIPTTPSSPMSPLPLLTATTATPTLATLATTVTPTMVRSRWRPAFVLGAGLL